MASVSSKTSAERTFFDLRFSVPGFIFIIVFLIINPSFLSQGDLLGLTIEEIQAFFSIMVGFLTIISGTPIGFLVSQVWWLFWVLIGSHYGGVWRRERGEPYNILVDEYKIKNDEKSLRTVYNYLVHSKSDVETRSYINKRWDTFILIGSSAFAIGLGLFFGYVMRIFVFKTQFTDVTKIYHCFLIIPGFLILFSFLLFDCYFKILKEHDNMTILLIRKLGEPRKLKDIIPDHYFN